MRDIYAPTLNNLIDHPLIDTEQAESSLAGVYGGPIGHGHRLASILSFSSS